jgi:hypothetical protein
MKDDNWCVCPINLKRLKIIDIINEFEMNFRKCHQKWREALEKKRKNDWKLHNNRSPKQPPKHTPGRGHRKFPKGAGAMGLWLLMEGSADAAEFSYNWWNPNNYDNATCHNCVCATYVTVVTVPSWWVIGYETEYSNKVLSDDWENLGNMSAADCRAMMDSYEEIVTVVRGFTIYNVYNTICRWE